MNQEKERDREIKSKVKDRDNFFLLISMLYVLNIKIKFFLAFLTIWSCVLYTFKEYDSLFYITI